MNTDDDISNQAFHVPPQSRRCRSHRLSSLLSAPPTCGFSWTPTASTGMAPLSSGRWSTAPCPAPCTTCSPSTRPRTKSATWIPTPSTRSASCWPDLWRAAPVPRDHHWGPRPNVLVSWSYFTAPSLETLLKSTKSNQNISSFIFFFRTKGLLFGSRGGLPFFSAIPFFIIATCLCLCVCYN